MSRAKRHEVKHKYLHYPKVKEMWEMESKVVKGRKREREKVAAAPYSMAIDKEIGGFG